MRHLPARWNALAIALALGMMLGCQGFSTGKSNTQDQGPQNPGTLTAAPASLSFGNVEVGTSQALVDTLTNTGGSNLTVTDAAVTGAGLSTTGLSLPLTLAAGQSATFSVVFSPQSLGSVSGSLALTNDGSSAPLNIAITGTAVAAGSLSGNPTSFSFGNVQVGMSQSQTETLKNTGSESLSLIHI